MLLAVDTSTAWASVALFDGHTVLAEETWHADRGADELFPTIERLASLARTSLASVSRVAVATGPGSFTGVRVAIAAAQGLARGSGAAIVGVPTPDVVAYPHASAGMRTCALLRAGRSEWYAALYWELDRRWGRRSPFMVGTLEELSAELGTHTLLAGELDGAAEEALRALLGASAVFAPPASRLRRAGYLAELGWRALEEGAPAAPRSIEPIYVQRAGAAR